MLKIFIALSTFNRKNITKLCLENLKNIVDKDGNSILAIYDDASTKYGEDFLKQYSQNVLRFRVSGVLKDLEQDLLEILCIYIRILIYTT